MENSIGLKQVMLPSRVSRCGDFIISKIVRVTLKPVDDIIPCENINIGLCTKLDGHCLHCCSGLKLLQKRNSSNHFGCLTKSLKLAKQQNGKKIVKFAKQLISK